MALPATIVWEVRTTGATTAGGGWNTAGSGVDYSQQNAAQYALTGIASAGAGNTVLSALAASDMVGNVAQVISGTNYTTGFYEVTSVVVGVSITFGTNNAGTSISTGVGASGVINIGGALSTLTGPAKQAGHKIYVKATATYSTTAATALGAVAGTNLAWVIHEGYTTTRGDNGQITVQRSSGSGFTMVTIANNFNLVKNFIIDGASGTTITGLSITGAIDQIENIKIQGCTTRGVLVSTGNRHILRNVWVNGQTGTASFEMQVVAYLEGCMAIGGSVTGFAQATAITASQITYVRCIAAGQTGSADGWKLNSTQTARLFQCIAYGNAGNGILLDTTTNAAAIDGVSIRNCIFDGNTGYGIAANAANVPFIDSDYNAFNGNTAGARQNLPAGAHDVTLSGSPFTNAASGDFSLDNTTSEGAACRAAGWPGTLLYGGAGYEDIGALQHQDAGGGSVSYVINRVSNQFYGEGA